MQNQAWSAAVAACADPARARHFEAALVAAGLQPRLRGLSDAAAQALAALLSGSQVLGEWLVQHPDWLEPLLEPEVRAPSAIGPGPRAGSSPAQSPLSERDCVGALGQVRMFQQRELTRIALRDLAGTAEVSGVTLGYRIWLTSAWRRCFGWSGTSSPSGLGFRTT
ncbi:MAG: hypothetical protein HS113_05525 [Verrucomicrobiales bacterium]|nr:hypothetical protein [Verrucomicrobiales bacterium]